MNKKEILNKYKSVIISSINLALDSISNIEDLRIEEKNISKERYNIIKNKIDKNEELSTAEYTLLSMICLNASDNLADSAKKLFRSAEDMKDLAKAFMVQLEV